MTNLTVTTVSASSGPTTSRPPLRIRLWLLITVSTVGLIALFWKTGRTAMVRWDVDPASSHGYIVPPAAGYLVWHLWQKTGASIPDRIPRFTLVTASVSILIGSVFHLYLAAALEPGIVIFADGLCFVITTLGLLLLIAGPDTGKVYLPAFLMLFFMVPIPLSWQQPGADWLQQIVAWTSEMSLWLLGQTVFREGYILFLPDTVLEVAEGCSGLRQLVVFVGISAFFGVHSGDIRQAVCLLLLSLPVSVAANTLRITATGLIHLYAGSDWAEGALHEAEGLITALIGTAALFGAARLLHQWSSDPAPQEDLEIPADTELKSGSPQATAPGIAARLAVALALLPFIAADHLCQQAAAAYRRPPVPLRSDLSQFPTLLGPWSGRNVPVAREYFLYGDDHLNRVYVNRETGQTVTLWMVYTHDGRDRIHHPRICMKAVGCREVTERTRKVSLSEPGLTALRLYFQQPSDSSGQWIIYWSRILDSGEPVEHSRLLRLLAAPPSRRSGLTVEIFAPEIAPADAVGAEKFARLVHQSLEATTLP